MQAGPTQCPVASGTSSPPTQKAAPTASPPPALAARPSGVTPPLVPGSTSLAGLVISRGLVGDKTPSSEDQVSPPQHA